MTCDNVVRHVDAQLVPLPDVARIGRSPERDLRRIETIGAELRAMMPFLKRKKEEGIPQAQTA